MGQTDLKQKRNRLKVKRLVVLGAGASYAASHRRNLSAKTTPLDETFCKVIRSIDLVNPHWVKHSVSAVEKAWKQNQPMDEFGLEAAIMRQLSTAEFFDAIHQRRKIGTNLTNAEYLNHIAHLITFVLKRCGESDPKLYGKLAKKLFPMNRSVDTMTNRVITFNYDILLDAYLLKRFRPSAVYFDDVRTSEKSVEEKQRFEHPLLIKLHGSINWRCSSDEFESIVSDGADKDKVQRINKVWLSQQTPQPADNISPCIIPPLPSKPITRISLYRFLWTKAFEYLTEAEELVVCGYSLPDTDQLAGDLFSQFSNQNLKAVTVVDPDPMILSKWRNLLTRKKIAPRWVYFGNFQEYVESL